MLLPLDHWFDRIFVINCRRRTDRKAQMEEELSDKTEKPIFVEAVDGRVTTCPGFWRAGRGAWGCLRSHQNVLESLLQDQDEGGFNWGAALILEDDAKFVPGYEDLLNLFMLAVPEDWDQLYLGGQHRRNPQILSEQVWRGVSVNRSHAYAVSPRSLPLIYRHISYAPDYLQKTEKPVHIDHQLERAHRRQLWNVYCPPKWLAAQRAGLSDIMNTQLKERIWQR